MPWGWVWWIDADELVDVILLGGQVYEFTFWALMPTRWSMSVSWTCLRWLFWGIGWSLIVNACRRPCVIHQALGEMNNRKEDSSAQMITILLAHFLHFIKIPVLLAQFLHSVKIPVYTPVTQSEQFDRFFLKVIWQSEPYRNQSSGNSFHSGPFIRRCCLFIPSVLNVIKAHYVIAR